MTDINDFISFVKCCYRTSFNEPLVFPKYNELQDHHHQYVAHADVEAKMFDIEDDLNSLYMLAHLDNLHKYSLLPRLEVLLLKYQYEDMDVVDRGMVKLEQLLNHYIDNEVRELIHDHKVKSQSIQESICTVGSLIRLKRDGTNKEKLLKLIDYLTEVEDNEVLKYTKLRLYWENENGNE